MDILTVKKKVYGWRSCSAGLYTDYYNRYGGSICVHPRVLTFLQSATGVKINYFCKDNAAFCTFDNSLVYKNKTVPFVFDDLLFPADSQCKVMLPYKTKRLSPHTRINYRNAIYSDFLKHKIAYVKESFSNTTVRKRSAELRKIQKAGFTFQQVSAFNAKTLSQIYCELFNLRWQGKIQCFDHVLLEEALSELNDLVFGSVLSVKGNPCAFDLIFKAESPSWIYFDDINGGVDPQFMQQGVGTALLWKNITDSQEECQRANKKSIFSLGAYLKGWEYKLQWCNIRASGRVVF